MRVRERSSSVLIIEDPAITVRVLGAVFAVVGGFALYAGITRMGQGALWVAYVVGAVFLAVGLGIVLKTQAGTYAFDRAARAVHIRRKGLLGRTAEEIPLDQVSDVILDQSTDSDGGRTFRVAFVMSDGQRRGWRAYWTNSYRDQAACVTAAREFLGTAATPRAPNGLQAIPPRFGAAKTPAEAAKQRKSMGCVLGAMAAFCLVFLGVAVHMLRTEHVRLTTYRPVEVTVGHVGIEYVPGDEGGGTYRPQVRYVYTVDGRNYASERVTMLNVSSGRRWAEKHASRFTPGRTYTGWYDPADPAKSYLVRERSAMPYLFGGIPLTVLLLIGYAARHTARETTTA